MDSTSFSDCDVFIFTNGIISAVDILQVDSPTYEQMTIFKSIQYTYVCVRRSLTLRSEYCKRLGKRRYPLFVGIIISDTKNWMEKKTTRESLAYF